MCRKYTPPGNRCNALNCQQRQALETLTSLQEDEMSTDTERARLTSRKNRTFTKDPTR